MEYDDDFSDYLLLKSDLPGGPPPPSEGKRTSLFMSGAALGPLWRRPARAALVGVCEGRAGPSHGRGGPPRMCGGT